MLRPTQQFKSMELVQIWVAWASSKLFKIGEARGVLGPPPAACVQLVAYT